MSVSSSFVYYTQLLNLVPICCKIRSDHLFCQNIVMLFYKVSCQKPHKIVSAAQAKSRSIVATSIFNTVTKDSISRYTRLMIAVGCFVACFLSLCLFLYLICALLFTLLSRCSVLGLLSLCNNDR